MLFFFLFSLSFDTCERAIHGVPHTCSCSFDHPMHVQNSHTTLCFFFLSFSFSLSLFVFVSSSHRYHHLSPILFLFPSTFHGSSLFDGTKTRKRVLSRGGTITETFSSLFPSLSPPPPVPLSLVLSQLSSSLSSLHLLPLSFYTLPYLPPPPTSPLPKLSTPCCSLPNKSSAF